MTNIYLLPVCPVGRDGIEGSELGLPPHCCSSGSKTGRSSDPRRSLCERKTNIQFDFFFFFNLKRISPLLDLKFLMHPPGVK